MIKSLSPWKPTEDCPHEGFEDFRKNLISASYHNAAPGSGEMSAARSSTRAAAEVAIDQKWPYWAIQRMFNEISPLVAWDQFMQAYINLLYEGYQNG